MIDKERVQGVGLDKFEQKDFGGENILIDLRLVGEQIVEQGAVVG